MLRQHKIFIDGNLLYHEPDDPDYLGELFMILYNGTASSIYDYELDDYNLFPDLEDVEYLIHELSREVDGDKIRIIGAFQEALRALRTGHKVNWMYYH